MELRATEPGDLKYAGAAWKLGSSDLAGLDLPKDAPPDVFLEALREHLITYYQHHYTLLADTPKGRVPVGFALLQCPDAREGVLVGKRIIWMPWASRRNRLECAVHLGNALRNSWVVLWWTTTQAEQAFFDHVCRYGVARRAGTLYDLQSGRMAAYQTRASGIRRS